MLKEVHLRNFQKHKNKKIEFSSPITVICGPSDCGKSSIIRALQWVLTNSIKGQGFIRHGSEYCKVTAIFDDFKVERFRSSSDNLYAIIENGKKKKRKSFRNSVPTDISRKINLSEYAIQEQHAPVFWLSAPTTQASEMLNKVVNLQLIDRSFVELRKRQSSQTIKKQALLLNIKNLNDKVQALEGLPDHSKEINLGLKLVEDLEQLEDIEDLLLRFEAETQKRLSLSKVLQRTKSKMDLAKKTQKKIDGLSEILNLIDTYQIALEASHRIKKKRDHVEEELKKIKVCPTCKQVLKQ